MNSINLCHIKNIIIQNRFVFVDEKEIYYLWQIYYSDFGTTLSIDAFKKEGVVFKEIETTRVYELIKYLKFWLLDKNTTEIIEFFKSISFLEFNIHKKIANEFDEKFYRLFLRDIDSEFIFLDPHAKHWIIDFKKIRNHEKEFLKEPEFFPFYISNIDVVLTKDLKLLKNEKDITIEDFWQIYEEYKLGLVSIIKKKDVMLRKIENDLAKRFFESLAEINNKSISDYEIDAKVEIYDLVTRYEPIFALHYSRRIFKDKTLYSLKVYGYDFYVGRLCWSLIDTFGLNILSAQVCIWSEIEIINQKFFKLK
jgi:hypothetical protein